MANVVSVKLDVKTTGMTEAEAASAKIAANLKKAQSEAKGYQKVMNSGMPAGPARATQAPANQGNGESKTARSIGAGGGTGSAASDFAAQASGLGGLVHLYATFAANIFAVSAAWSALSKAMDTTNLVKGLDQIGASTGKNLGSLAKQMVNVADGAISMQQAMSSTAMASAGGMSNANILRMTQVAKNASLALGRDLPDSMDRITKGIIKTQPELLDELGIMTRVIPAQQKYAEQIGKTTSSLTDFEKRQAFANAVLAEGEAKFGAIAMNANPYTKVLASVQNLMQSGMELINKVLGPIMEMLSSSPAGLATVLTAVGGMLLKQALPAIGMFKDNAKRAAEEAYRFAQQKQQDAEEAAIARDNRAAARAKASFVNSDAGKTAAKAANNVRFNSNAAGDDLSRLMRKDVSKYSTQDLMALREHHSKLLAVDKDTVTKFEQNLAKSLAVKLKETTKYLNVVGKIEEDAAEKNAKMSEGKLLAQENINKRIADRHTARMNKTEVISSAVDTTSISGLRAGFSNMMSDIRKKDMEGWNKWSTVASGSVSIVTQKIGSVLSAFSMWGQLAALLVVGLGILNSKLTSSAKESAAYGTSIDALESSLANMSRTLEVISKKDPLEQLNIDSTQARANALNDLSDSLSNVVFKFDRLKESQNGWDKFVNGFFDFFGKGDGDKLAEGLSNTVTSALTALEEGPIKIAAQESFKKILNVGDVSSPEKLKNAIKDLDEQSIRNLAANIDKELKVINTTVNNSASALTALKTALTDINKQGVIQSNKLLPTDDFSKMGMEMVKGANALRDALNSGPIASLKALANLAKNTQTLRLIPGTAEFGSKSKEMDDLLLKIQKTQKEAREAQEALNSLGKTQLAVTTSYNPNTGKTSSNTTKNTEVNTKELEGQLKKAEAIRSTANASVAQLEIQAASLAEKYRGIATQFAEAAFTNLSRGFKVALMEASIISAKGYIDVMKQAGIGTADASFKVASSEISAQKQAIEAQFAVIDSETKLKLSIDLLNLNTERSNLLSEQASARANNDVDALKRNTIKLTDNYNKLDDLNRMVSVLKNSTANLSKDARSGKMSEDTKFMQEKMPAYMGQLMTKMAQMAKLDAQLGVEGIKHKVEKNNELIDQQKRIRDYKIEEINTSQKEISLLKSMSPYYADKLESEQSALEISKLKLQQETKQGEFDKKQFNINQVLARQDNSGSTKDRFARNNDTNIAQAALTKERQQSARDFEVELFILEDKRFVNERESIEKLRKLRSEAELERINAADLATQNILNAEIAQIKLSTALGDITEDSASKLIIAIESQKANSKYIKDMADITAKGLDKFMKAQTELERVLNANKSRRPDRQEPTAELEANVDSARQELFSGQDSLTAAKEVTDVSQSTSEQLLKNATNWVDGAKASLNSYLGDVEKVGTSTGAIISKSFKGMEDALTDFVMTGKLDFASLANSIIADMVRIAIQQSITGPLAKAAMSFFMADGGAFDGGVQKFAKGSGFTNSIVSEPTLFAFAQGTGMMGEAGPEAIMPLTRDAGGTLGVRAMGGQQSGQSPVNVTINVVESKEKAGTQERQTENGVDMITVFVEKVKSSIAGDISRGTGSVTGALSRTYGLNRVAGAY